MPLLLRRLGLAIHFPSRKPRLRVAVISLVSCHKHSARVRLSNASRFAMLNLGTQWTGALVRPDTFPATGDSGHGGALLRSGPESRWQWRARLRSFKAGYVPVNWKLHGHKPMLATLTKLPFSTRSKTRMLYRCTLACVYRSGCELNAKGFPLAQSTRSGPHESTSLNQSASRASCLPGGTEKPISGNAGGLFCALNPTTITMLSFNPSARLMAEIRSQTVRPFVPALIKR